MRFIGRGCAYHVESAALLGLRSRLATLWAEDLKPQDAQRFSPHVTIQNKVAPGTARTLFDELSASFEPFEAQATGLLLWRYRQGPWEGPETFPFRR